MASKRRLSTSLSPEPSTIDTSVTQSDTSPKPNNCLICGDIARIINYGALSCQSCKTFFRRNGFRPETVRPCIFNKFCEVNMQTRHNCTACRLAKCFTVGMSSDLIRKEDYKKSKRPLLTTSKSNNTEQVNIVQQLPTLDLIKDDRSLLDDFQWTLLSNILSAYDTYSPVTQMCQNLDNLSTLPIELQLNIINPIEIISQMFTFIQSFISSSPDFRILTTNEQSSLIERNFYGIFGLYSILFFRDTNILGNVKCMEAFTNIYGEESMLLLKTLDTRLDPDATLIKLILIIFAFSSNCLVIDKHNNIERDSLLYGTFRLLGSQNVYSEVLWKYMLYRYGYNQAIIRFSRLIQLHLCILKNLTFVYENNEIHRNLIGEIISKAKQSLTINKNEQTSLWGKN